MVAESAPLGRRERAKRERAGRVAAAAGRLFEAHGFDAVTTQRIAAEADVAEGTVFRYARNKDELLVMVTNTRFAQALATGETAAQLLDPANVVGRLLALAGALLDPSAGRADNAALYQRMLLFSSPEDCFAAEGVAIALRWEAAMTLPFAELCAANPERTERDATVAGRAAWDAVQLAVTRRLSPYAPSNPLTDLGELFTLLVRGIQRTSATHNTNKESR